MQNYSLPKKGQIPSEIPEEEQDLESAPENKVRGRRLTQLMQRIHDALIEGKESPLSEKFEFLLEEAAFQQPEISSFIGKQSYYTRGAASSDERYVASREKNFSEDNQHAKVAEAIVGEEIVQNELFPSIGNIRAVVTTPVTRYDDISNGIDQAVTILTKDDKKIPFSFDVTIGKSKETFVKKFFRPYFGKSDVRQIGQSKLKYGRIPELDDDGAYKGFEYGTIDPIPRITLAFDEEEVEEMAEAVTIEDGYREGTFDIYGNPSSERVLHTVLQIHEQCVFYLSAAKANRSALIFHRKRTDKNDTEKIAELDRQIEELGEQVKQYQDLVKTLEPALKYSYVQARKDTINNKNNARTDSNIRRKLFCSGYPMSSTGAMLDALHYYEGWGERTDEEEEHLIEIYIKEGLAKIDAEYSRSHPGTMMGPSYTAAQIAEVEYEATMRARKEMREKCSHRMKERLDEGVERYEELEAEKHSKRESA